MADFLDGTANTLLVGEVLPVQTADSNFYHHNGCTFGTTVRYLGTPPKIGITPVLDTLSLSGKPPRQRPL